jgi:hypothetical protein
MFDRDKHSSLSDPFINYEENEVLWLRLLEGEKLATCVHGILAEREWSVLLTSKY